MGSPERDGISGFKAIDHKGGGRVCPWGSAFQESFGRRFGVPSGNPPW